MELGVAYLWIEQFQAAWEHFHEANQREPKRRSIYYGMAGVAKWCMRKRDEAITQWELGLNCKYADTGGVGITNALLLFVASVFESQKYSREKATKHLTDRSTDPRAAMWPGPVALFLLGRSKKAELRNRCVGRDGSEDFMARWRADFYFGIHAYLLGDHGYFQEMMRKVIVTEDEDFDLANHRTRFVRKFWHEEFFLANSLVGAFGADPRRYPGQTKESDGNGA